MEDPETLEAHSDQGYLDDLEDDLEVQELMKQR
jgi:hypothetical protein